MHPVQLQGFIRLSHNDAGAYMLVMPVSATGAPCHVDTAACVQTFIRKSGVWRSKPTHPLKVWEAHGYVVLFIMGYPPAIMALSEFAKQNIVFNLEQALLQSQHDASHDALIWTALSTTYKEYTRGTH